MYMSKELFASTTKYQDGPAPDEAICMKMLCRFSSINTNLMSDRVVLHTWSHLSFMIVLNCGDCYQSHFVDKIRAQAKMIKLKLSCFEHITRMQGSFGKDSNARKNRRWQEKRKNKHEMDWLHEKSHRHESAGAEQGCWGQGVGTSLLQRVARSQSQCDNDKGLEFKSLHNTGLVCAIFLRILITVEQRSRWGRAGRGITDQ